MKALQCDELTGPGAPSAGILVLFQPGKASQGQKDKHFAPGCSGATCQVLSFVLLLTNSPSLMYACWLLGNTPFPIRRLLSNGPIKYPPHYHHFLNSSPEWHSAVCVCLFFLRFYLFVFRERIREGEREGEKRQCVVASRVPPTGDLAHNPGLCPDQELNW